MTETAPSMPAPESRAPARWLLRGAILIVALLLVWATNRYFSEWRGSARFQSTDDAYLQTDLTPLSAKVSGYVHAVPVADYATVKTGEMLVELEDDDYRAALAQVQANVSAAQAALEALAAQRTLQLASIRAATASVEGAAALSDRAELENTRQAGLRGVGAGTNQLVEQAEASRRQLAADLERQRAQLSAARAQLSVIDAQTKQAQAALAAQRAAESIAALNLRYTRIVTPESGLVGQRQVRPGQYLTAGTQVFTLAPLPRVWVIANFKEIQLTRLEIGQPATFTVDAFPGHTLTGYVVAYAPASGAQFSLLPPDNASGNFTKVVQRLAVKISISNDDGLAARLRPGMSVIATVDTQAKVTSSVAAGQ